MQEPFETARDALLHAVVGALEGCLPVGAPVRGGGGRSVWDVLVDDLVVADVRAALRGIAAGAGGELKPTRAGNVSFCSAESSALMAVNFLAPAPSLAAFPEVGDCSVRFERELRVAGVRSPVGPTLDAVLDGTLRTLAFECKTAEPWRWAPDVALSQQYDAPARRVSEGTWRSLAALRSAAVSYRCLDAAQLLKHLLGIHSALEAGTLREPVSLVLLYWRPSRPGSHGSMFDALADELADFAGRLRDQPVEILGWSTDELLARWEGAGSARLGEHARELRARYDPALANAP